MKFEVIAKKDVIPTFDRKATKLQHITYYDIPYHEYEGKEITEKVIAKLLRKIPAGLNLYWSLTPYGEDDWLEVNCDGKWLSLGYHSDGGCDNYYSYNADFAYTINQIMKGDFSDKSIYTHPLKQRRAIAYC